MPSSPGYVRDYRQERLTESKARKQHRAERNKARRIAKAYYGAAAIAGKDVDHKKPLDQGGGNTRSNLRLLSPSANRSYPRTSAGQMKRRGK